MYQYLRAIGLGKYNTKKKIRELTDYVKENAVRRDPISSTRKKN